MDAPQGDPLETPLDDPEWDTVADFLDQPGGPDLNHALGLIVAMETAPSPPDTDWWLQRIRGDRPVAPDEPMTDLLRRLYATVRQALEHQQVQAPMPDEHDEIQTWCRGFMEIVHRSPAWQDDIEAMGPVFPIAVLAGETPLNAPEDGPDHQIDDEETWLQTAREALPDLVFTAREQTRPHTRSQDTYRRPFHIGRNDPCPCGSGKKYKRCCAQP